MKSCPTCNRTFEDTFSFCLVDGAILSAPFDPLATKANAIPRDTGGARTEVLPSASQHVGPPLAHTVPSPYPPSQETVFANPVPPSPPLRADSGERARWGTPDPGSETSNERKDVSRGFQLVVGLVVVGVLCFLYSIASIAGNPITLSTRFVSSLSGAIFGSLFKRAGIGAIFSLLVGGMSGILLIRTYRPFIVSEHNLSTVASYAAYALIGWAVTRLVGVVLRRIASNQ